MEQFFERGVGGARQNSIEIPNWYLLAIIPMSVLLILCKTADGQALEQSEGQLNTGTVKRADLKIRLLNDFRVASINRSHLFLSRSPLGEDLEKPGVAKKFYFRQYNEKNDKFLIEMNRKLDSAWRKFDERCRARDKLSRHPF